MADYTDTYRRELEASERGEFTLCPNCGAKWKVEGDGSLTRDHAPECEYMIWMRGDHA